MDRIAYTVSASFPTTELAGEFVAWLEDGHIDDIIKAGAHSAMIVRLDQEPGETGRRVEVHYIFASREVFDHYVSVAAPALRAEGLKRFGPEQGVKYARRVGVIV